MRQNVVRFNLDGESRLYASKNQFAATIWQKWLSGFSLLSFKCFCDYKHLSYEPTFNHAHEFEGFEILNRSHCTITEIHFGIIICVHCFMPFWCAHLSGFWWIILNRKISQNSCVDFCQFHKPHARFFFESLHNIRKEINDSSKTILNSSTKAAHVPPSTSWD